MYLVGAGPGDPGLLTLRGLECLKRADLVLYDGLVNPLLLRHTHGVCERTSRRVDDAGCVPQAQVNERLIAEAKAGKTIVRLKGGDPFLFGRGGEEAVALEAAGIPYEVIPGVTAATAVAASAGVSLTHRGLASAVAFVTGHEDPTKAEPALDFDALAKFSGTLVFYMGWHRLESIANSLIAHGKSPVTPTAVICRGTTPQQKTVTGPLNHIAAIAKQADLHPPSLIVIGECVTLRSGMTWFESRPLFGTSIGIPRAEEQADDIVTACWELGADPVVMPLIAVRPTEGWAAVDAAIANLRQYDAVIFTSVNGVRSFLNRITNHAQRDVRCFGDTLLAAIGPATARALEASNLKADFVPQEYRAEAVAEGLIARLKPSQRVLWVRGSRARDVLPEKLTAAGIQVDSVIVYHNEDVTQLPTEAYDRLQAGTLDWIALSSPSIARSLHRLVPAELLKSSGVRLAAISPVTASAANECGLPIAVTAQEYTWPGLLAAVRMSNKKQGTRNHEGGN